MNIIMIQNTVRTYTNMKHAKNTNNYVNGLTKYSVLVKNVKSDDNNNIHKLY